MVCAACTADVPDDDLFCENCGVKLGGGDAPTTGCTCGAAEGDVDEDGFCLCCGRRVRRPASDHMEEALSPVFAAVSDRGLRHDHNEDRFAIVQTEAGCAVVVCDGVSATSNAEVASGVASEEVARMLGDALREGAMDDAEPVISDAIAHAVEALRARTGEGGGENAPSTTLVAAVVRSAEITVGWVGDSRAYWMDAEGVRLLTRDHSWMNMVVENGVMTEEEAQAAPQAHAITRWLGVDAEGASTPEFVHHTAEGAGTLLLCTDGLWNYAPSLEEIGELLKASDGADALSAARALVTFANEKGGRDNITVVILSMPGPADVGEATLEG